MRGGLCAFFSKHLLIGVLYVRLQGGERAALAHNPWDFDQLADIPGSVFPVFKRED
jgi:hypothetical protein